MCGSLEIFENPIWQHLFVGFKTVFEGKKLSIIYHFFKVFTRQFKFNCIIFIQKHFFKPLIIFVMNTVSLKTKLLAPNKIPSIIDKILDFKIKPTEGGRITNSIYRFNYPFIKDNEYKIISQTQMCFNIDINSEDNYSVFTVENDEFGKEIINILKKEFDGELIDF